jgi:hypothetical protein
LKEPGRCGSFRTVSGIRVSLTAGNVRNSHIYLREHLDFFPPDVLGAPNARDGEGVSVKLRFAVRGRRAIATSRATS